MSEQTTGLHLLLTETPALPVGRAIKLPKGHIKILFRAMEEVNDPEHRFPRSPGGGWRRTSGIHSTNNEDSKSWIRTHHFEHDAPEVVPGQRRLFTGLVQLWQHAPSPFRRQLPEWDDVRYDLDSTTDRLEMRHANDTGFELDITETSGRRHLVADLSGELLVFQTTTGQAARQRTAPNLGAANAFMTEVFDRYLGITLGKLPA